MTLVLRLILLLSVTLMPLRGLADVTYRFDITTAYATSHPFPNRLDTAFTAEDTGYLQIANTGAANYLGIIRMIAHPGFPGVADMSFDLPNGFIPAGGVVSIAVPNDASDVGGFNAPMGSFQPGIILYLEGTVSHDGASAGIKIAVRDLDIHSGVIRTDPNGYQTDSSGCGVVILLASTVATPSNSASHLAITHSPAWHPSHLSGHPAARDGRLVTGASQNTPASAHSQFRASDAWRVRQVTKSKIRTSHHAVPALRPVAAIQP